MDSDVVHEFGSHPEWNESFYFNFYDKKNDIFSFMRLGLKPNMNDKTAFCFFLMPDASTLGWMGRKPFQSTELEVESLRFEKRIPEKKWHLAFSGRMEERGGDIAGSEDVSLDAEFECLNEIFDYRQCVSGIEERISQQIASEHLEQFGRARGKLMIGASEYVLDGLGERDHSWGVRDWSAPKMWTWLTCQFSETSALNVTKLVMDAGEVDAGFIHIDGVNVPLVKIKIHTEWDANGGPRRLDLVAEDKRGTAHKLQAMVMRKTVVPFAGRDDGTLSLLHEPLAEYHMGPKVGYGVAEYLVRIQ